MALTPEIRAPQAGLIATVRQAASELRLPQSNVLSIYNIPAEQIQGTYAGVNVAYRQVSQQIRSTSAQVMLVSKGKVDNPKLSAWAFTLDGHDNFVLRLGTFKKTLIFDISTGQWSWWSSDTSDRWRANVGLNWKSSGDIPYNYGSNVIVGDDSAGILYVLNPEKGTDDTLYGNSQVTFPRVATGQMATRDRNFFQIFSVDLTASLGNPALTANTVKLEYSDDQGHSYVNAGEKTIVPGDYLYNLTWRSLGLVRTPGRLFKVTDNGAFARIDSLDINE